MKGQFEEAWLAITRRSPATLASVVACAPEVLRAYSEGGLTLLHRAAILDAKTCVEALLAAGADPRLHDGNGLDAFDLALDHGARDCAELILSCIKANPLPPPACRNIAECAELYKTAHPWHHAARKGWFAHFAARADNPDPGILGQKDARGESVLDILMRRGALEEAFIPQIWHSRLQDMAAFAARLPTRALEKVDLPALTGAAQALALRRGRPQRPAH